jgi:Ala-tRNA(Pro) deacylase
MTIAKTLGAHLAAAAVDYDVVSHLSTPSASRTAQAAHITGERVAKAVVLHDDSGYLLAVVPSTHRVEFGTLHDLLGRSLNLATEAEIADLFGDCDVGAVPPLGAAYGLKVVLDESLLGQPEIFFEGGDHASLVHVGGGDFASLMADAQRGQFSHHS